MQVLDSQVLNQVAGGVYVPPGTQVDYFYDETGHLTHTVYTYNGYEDYSYDCYDCCAEDEEYLAALLAGLVLGGMLTWLD